MTLLRLRAGLLACVLFACSGARAPQRTTSPVSVTRPATAEELVRMRCSLDGRDTVTTWTGTVYSFVPGERQRELFDVIGMNVARCLHDDRGWYLTSRELMYYLDPGTSTVLQRWTNPWTGESVPVVHVANALVQMPLGGSPPMHVTDTTATIAIDVPLFYPNPLARDALRQYSPEVEYQAGEFFSLSATAAAVTDAKLATVPEMTLVWFRISPWLPWMNMGERPGRLVVSARGHKVAGIEQLPASLAREIDERLPLYRSAPRCIVAAKNDTSWTYFAAHLAEYQAGGPFPVPAPAREEKCGEPRRR